MGLLLPALGQAQSPPEARAASIRKIVKNNLHFSVHCFCRAYTSETQAAVRKKVTSSDVPALILLLKDEPGPTTFAARDLLIEFADVSAPLLKAAQMSRDDELSAVALDVLVEIDEKRGGDSLKTIQERHDARARDVDVALPQADPSVVALIEQSVAAVSPGCQRRVNYSGFWMDWDCGANTLKIGVTEFSSGEAASRRMGRVTQGRGKVVPLEAVGEESGISDWKKQRANEWRGGAFLAFKRDVFVVTAETTIMAGGMGEGEPERVQKQTRVVAKEIDAALARRALVPERPR